MSYRYYYPEDANTSAKGEREVLESDHLDENWLDAIVGKATVLTAAAFKALPPDVNPRAEHIYYACRFYDPIMKLFRSLHGTVQHSKFSRRYLAVGGEHAGAALSKAHKLLAPEPVILASSTKKGKAAGSAAAASTPTALVAPVLAGDKFSVACSQLQLSAAPAELPCREPEKASITQFLDTAIRNAGVGHALYISGKLCCSSCVCGNPAHSPCMCMRHELCELFATVVYFVVHFLTELTLRSHSFIDSLMIVQACQALARPPLFVKW